MRDATATAAAVFEPEEAGVLETAFKMTTKKLATSLGAHHKVTDPELARVIHNLGRSRLRLKKPLQTDRHAAEVADEAIEHFSYLEQAPDAILEAARDPGAGTRSGQRVIGAFPSSFRQPPVSRL